MSPPCRGRDRSSQLEYTFGNGVEDMDVAQVYHSEIDSCLLLIGFVFSAVTVATASLGITPGELNNRQLYVAFGGLTFVSAFLEAIGYSL